MSIYPHPKYRFKSDYTTRLCSNYLQVPCKDYEDLAFKKGNVFEASASINPKPNIIYGIAKMSPFEVPLSVLEKVPDDTPVTAMFEKLSTANKLKQNQQIDEDKLRKIKKIFIIPTVLALGVIWIYGLKKL